MTEPDRWQTWCKWKRLGFWLTVIPPGIGIPLTVLGVVRAFRELSAVAPRGDPSSVSKPIGEVLIPTLIGLPVGLVGAAIFVTAVLKLRSVRGHLGTPDSNSPH